MEKNIIFDHYLDLTGVVCPLNFVKCCLALEKLSCNQVLKVDLDIGESEISVIEGLEDKGFKVKIHNKDSKKATLIVSSEEK